MDRPTTIAEVVTAFDEVIAWAEHEGSPVGYFPALHREVALAIGDAINDGDFDDGARMEAMVAAFASRYLDALHAFRSGGRPTRSWAAAFDSASDPTLTVVQHVLLGMTAHIGLDLGVVTATIAPGNELAGLRPDYDRINDILDSLVDLDRLAVDAISPRLRELDRLGHLSDQLVKGVIHDARDHAWDLAERLAPLDPSGRNVAVNAADEHIATWSRRITHPELAIRVLLREVIRPAETRAVAAVIAHLRLNPPHHRRHRRSAP